MERTCPEEHLNLSKSGFVSEEGHSGCKSQNMAMRALKGNVLCKIWFKWTYLANLERKRRTSSHLATIVSCALLQQDGRIPCPVDRNLEIFLTYHIDFLFIFELIFCKKIPLSRRVGYVMGGSVSGSVSG